MAKIFISFIHEEIKYAEAVGRFVGGMFEKTLEPFMSSDQFQIYAGEKWIERIMQELVGSKVVLLMLSPRSVKRPWVNFEAGAAEGGRIPMIPICFGGQEKGKLPKPYSSFQGINLRDSNAHYYLISSIAHHAKVLCPPPLFKSMTLATLGRMMGIEKPSDFETAQQRIYDQFLTDIAGAISDTDKRKARPGGNKVE